MNVSIQSRLPDPSLSYADSDTGSDVLKTIEKFLDNCQVPVCGGNMFILVKRYPNETDIDRLVARMRQYHVLATIIYSVEPSGGHHPETLYNLATKTNGFCAFDQKDHYTTTAIHAPSFFNPYLVYAANPQISGQGNISLATMRVPVRMSYWFEMTVQDQMPLDHSETVKLIWSISSNTASLGVPDGLGPRGYYSGNYVESWEALDQGDYSMSLNYKYSVNNLKTLQIRVYSRDPVNFWVPYDK